MRLELLRPLTEATGPFVTFSHDASRVDVAGRHEVEVRWEAAARDLAARGAPPAVVAAVGQRAVSSTGRAGTVGRVIVANADGVLLDLVLPLRPVRDEACWAPAPCLLPVFRSLSSTTRYAVARVDRAGADLEVVGLFGEAAEEQTVEGGHDVLHKVPGGGWAQYRYRTRVEDSWQRNAAAVAHELESLVRRHRPQLVLLEGDEQAMAALQQQAGTELASRLVRLRTGGRAEGTSAEAEQEAITAAVVLHVRQERQRLLERFAAALAKQQEGVDGRGAVVDALRRGQVEELLVNEDHPDDATLWVGTRPVQIGVTREDAVAAGAQDPVEQSAAAVLVWASVASDAGVSVLDPDGPRLAEGVGALLRWSDPATVYNPAAGAPAAEEAATVLEP